MNFSDNPQRRPVTAELLKASLAESSSLHPDVLMTIKLQVTKPIESLAALYLSLYFRCWQTDELVKTIAYRCYANNYQGKWELVQEVLEQELHNPEEMEAYMCSKNPYEFYGNILPLAVKLEKRVRYITRNTVTKRRKSKAIKYCEYKDNGSRRLPHEHHGDPPVKERSDFRSRVRFNPLLIRETIEEEVSLSGSAGGHILEKEVLT